LDGVIGVREGGGEPVKFFSTHADERFDGAVVLLGVKCFEFFVAMTKGLCYNLYTLL
jgi:hypothetical protein